MTSANRNLNEVGVIVLYSILFLHTLLSHYFKNSGYLPALNNSTFFSTLGLLLMILFFYFSDFIGRKKIVLLSSTALFLVYLINFLSPSLGGPLAATIKNFSCYAMLVSVISIIITERFSNTTLRYQALEGINLAQKVALIGAVTIPNHFSREAFFTFLPIILLLSVVFSFEQKPGDKKSANPLSLEKSSVWDAHYIYAFPAINYYLVFVYLTRVLETQHGYSKKELVTNSIYILITSVIRSLINVFLLQRFHPAKIAKYITYPYGFLLVLTPYFIHDLSSGWVLGLQILLIFLSPYLKAMDSLVIEGFSTSKRCFLNILSIFSIRFFVYTFTFLLFYTVKGEWKEYVFCMICVIILILFNKTTTRYLNSKS